ncbi:carboxylesterase/lipase family protein [Streptomyces spectabilis]|uniref:Carboxylic ester hydrolase n=1 Tax=Streptomyces spectabilis TaxID=68270 RepID=A0A7W8AVH3_STRST|nr:carboxylesterase family protein [Streptomyces spectabilis]MBB5105435.1 para-nitrobenzyl esterase [Streptomyces spectabilis]MCI3906624.1 carboxylesterase family protein [Streptomyces spectabilis]
MSRQADPVVETPAGAVRGLRDGSGERYRALPYAAAPTGAGRFAPPAPHPGWSGVRDATRPSPTAPQPVRDFGRLDMAPYFGPGWVPGEEYLTVDVHTPAADGGRRPVMVFVHGGGFVTGSNRAALYDGRAFVRDGIVLVTVNYRLGIPGFLDLAGAPANRGLLDVLAALRWVHDTVGAFGGDPGNLTVFGQSAGATLTGALLATPEAEGLFQRAIIQSGNGTGAFTPEQARRVTTAAAAALGVAPTAEAFGAIPDERFLAVLPALAGLDLRTSTAMDPLAGLSLFSLVLPVQPADALADGPAGHVDLLIGTNTEEGRLYLVPQGDLESTTGADVLAVATRVHADPEAALARHRAARPDGTPGELRSALLGQALFESGTTRMARAHARISGGRTHVYSFGYRSTALEGRLGAAHTVELPFVFDIADEPWLHGDTRLLGPDPAPPGLAARVHGAWVAFATTGDPAWAPCTPQDFAVEAHSLNK